MHARAPCGDIGIYTKVWSMGGMTMKPTLLSTQSALRSCTGASNVSPAAIYVDRRMRWDDGEYEAPVTPERRVLRQKVVGRTSRVLDAVRTREIWRNLRNGGGGLTSSPPRVLGRSIPLNAVKLRLGLRFLNPSASWLKIWASFCSFSSSSVGGAGPGDLRSGGALWDRVGRCRGRDFQVLTGGERKPWSTTWGVRDRLGRVAGWVKSVSIGDATGVRCLWSSAPCSISVSRVTMIGGLPLGVFERRPKVKSRVSG